jgi:hypothetical protein
VAKAVIEAYLREAGEYVAQDKSLLKVFQTYWAARKDRTYCASWFAVQLARAGQNFAPPLANRMARIKQLRGRIDKLPEPDRTWTLLRLHWDARGGDALISESDLIAACKRLGPERLVLMLRRKTPSNDPDLQQLHNNVSLFVLSHAGKLLRKEDAGELQSGEQWLPSPWWTIAAADLQREHAAALLHQAFRRFGRGGVMQVEDHLELALALWRLVGSSESAFLIDWFYSDKPATVVSADCRARFLKGVTHSRGLESRQLTVKIIQDERFEILDWQALVTLIEEVNTWVGKPIADPKAIPELPYTMEQYDRNPDDALRQYAKETKTLRETFKLWRQKLRASIPLWNQGC